MSVTPEAVVVSFRLGGADGVAVEARKWEWALGELGFEVRRVAGAIEDDGRPADTVLPGADLVIVDNLCSLPLNVEAAAVVARVAAGHRGRVLFRHHDLPWQRRHL